MGMLALGYSLFLVQTCFIVPSFVVDASITLIFYGLYFGVLSRDIIEFGSSRMASTIGVFELIEVSTFHLLVPLERQPASAQSSLVDVRDLWG